MMRVTTTIVIAALCAAAVAVPAVVSAQNPTSLVVQVPTEPGQLEHLVQFLPDLCEADIRRSRRRRNDALA